METGHQTHGIEQESGEETGNNATVNLGGYEIDTHIPELEDIGHPNVPEVNKEYISREINGKQDVELLSFIMNDPDFFAMIEGDAGTGKNIAIDTLCESANWPRVRVNFSISSSYESLVGRYAPVERDSIEEETFERSEVIESVANRLRKYSSVSDPLKVAKSGIPEGSSFRWVDGLLTRAVKNGWVFVADEINAAEAEALMPFNGLTEDRNSRYLTIEEKSVIIKPHDRFRLVATRNPVTYAGVDDMNSALESRAYIIPFGYHEDRALFEILTEQTNITENESVEVAESLVSLIQDIRMQEQEGTNFVTKISTRDVIKIGKLTEIMSVRQAAKTVILGIADPTDEEPLREMVETQKF